MPRVVPSQVVEFIDTAFPQAREQLKGKDFFLSSANSTRLAALLELIQQIPDELIVLDSARYVEFVVSIAGIRDTLESWKAHGSFKFEFIAGLRRLNPVTLIREALEVCPDQFPSAATTELTFIKDAALREILRLDIRAPLITAC